MKGRQSHCCTKVNKMRPSWMNSVLILIESFLYWISLFGIQTVCYSHFLCDEQPTVSLCVWGCSGELINSLLPSYYEEWSHNFYFILQRISLRHIHVDNRDHFLLKLACHTKRKITKGCTCSHTCTAAHTFCNALQYRHWDTIMQ